MGIYSSDCKRPLPTTKSALAFLSTWAGSGSSCFSNKGGLPPFEVPRAELACRVRHIKNAKLNATCPMCTGLFQCKYCPTEYQIDYKDFGDGVALIVTSWLDLGEGRTASDPMYQSHVLCNTFPQYQLDLPPIEVGSIRAAYEEEGFLSPKHSINMFTNNQLPLPRENLRYVLNNIVPPYNSYVGFLRFNQYLEFLEFLK